VAWQNEHARVQGRSVTPRESLHGLPRLRSYSLVRRKNVVELPLCSSVKPFCSIDPRDVGIACFSDCVMTNETAPVATGALLLYSCSLSPGE
jgi:hypothetical protein